MKKTILILMAIIGLVVLSYCRKEPPPTTLELILKDDLGNTVSGASVELYSSESDWNAATNQIGATLTSDASGKVRFTNVSNIIYYWYAEKDCKNNVNGAIASASALTPNITNTFNVILTSTGTLKFVNTSANPYRIYINGAVAFDVNGATTTYQNYMPVGSYSLRVLQLSGYLVYPTDITFSGILTCGSTLVTTFP